MGEFIDITGIGQAYVPSAWEPTLAEATTTKRHDLADGLCLNAIAKDLRLGRNILTQGSWEDVLRLLEALEERRGELVRPETKGAKDRSHRAAKRADPLARVLVLMNSTWDVSQVPHLQIPHLLEFLGDDRHAAQDHLVVIPAIALRDLLASLQERFPVSALGADLYAPNSVLQPRQQEVYDLLLERMTELRPTLPAKPICLDMGSGSGALALIMAKLLGETGATIWATDKLPEALATTRLNVSLLESQGMIPPGAVQVKEGGDLYDPVDDMRFDMIVFNPPWANAKPRTRLEIARYDWNQETAKRFLSSTPNHLTENGHLLLFYADNAGPKAVRAVQEAGEAAGLRAIETLSHRIRAARRWEHIYLYDLVMACGTEKDLA